MVAFSSVTVDCDLLFKIRCLCTKCVPQSFSSIRRKSILLVKRNCVFDTYNEVVCLC